MKTNHVIPFILIVSLYLSGCAGYVVGDLRNTRSDYIMPDYKENSFDYCVTYESDAIDDYLDQNIAGLITGWTFGIVPTYWTNTVQSKATVFDQEMPVYTANYKSRIHKFYGILWALILPIIHSESNALSADEGGGLRVEWGIKRRTLAKVIAEHGGAESQYGLLTQQNP